MSPSTGRSTRPVFNKSSGLNQLPATYQQSPLILPDTCLDHGSSSDVAGARSFVTQAWTIPDRPKPGRKPKQKLTRPDSKHSPQQSDQTTSLVAESSSNFSIQNLPPSVIDVGAEPTIKTRDLEARVFPEALQQAYINSLEAKIESLQTQQSEQAKYYKSLASQSTSKLNAVQSENDVLQTQVKVLRGEVLRLRKRIFQLSKKPTANAPSTASVIEEDCSAKESKVRKQGSCAAVENTSSFEQSEYCVKKPRHQPDHSNKNEPKLNATLESETQTSPKTLSEIYLVEDSRAVALQPNRSPIKRIPDFTSSDIYCGLCTSELDCVCRQVGLKPPLGIVDPPQRDLANNRLAVPIRRRSQPSTTNVWRLVTEDDSGSPLEVSPEIEPGLTRECNGNPKDCPACRDDPFGQAFCTALNQANVAQESKVIAEMAEVPTTGASSAATKRLSHSDPAVDAYVSIPCCGNPAICGSQICFENPSPSSGVKISCSEAWRQLKVHPNIGLANLQLLADVVARKSAAHPTTSTSIDPNSCLIDNPHDQSYQRQLSSRLFNESEDPSFSPHVTLSTVFENVHAGLDDDHPPENTPFQNNFSPRDSSNDYHDDDSNLCNNQHQKNIITRDTTINTTFIGRPVKFVEKESLDHALKMLDRANHRT